MNDHGQRAKAVLGGFKPLPARVPCDLASPSLSPRSRGPTSAPKLTRGPARTPTLAALSTRQHMEWSPDSELLFCGHYKFNAVRVLYTSGDRQVLARIEDPAFGSVGLRVRHEPPSPC